MKKKVSAQVIALRRLLSLCNEHTTAAGFTIDDIARLPSLKDRQIKRNSILQAFSRFTKLGIVTCGESNFKKQRLYRIKNTEWANAYIEGDPDKPWLPLTPTLPTDDFTDLDEHRDHFDIHMKDAWFEVLKRHGQEKNNQYTWRHGAFTLSVNGKSKSGQLFLKPYWRAEVKKQFGEEFFDYLQNLDAKGARRGDFCLPIGVKGQRFTIGGRPTQFSSSHYPAQLDIRASKGDDHIRDGLKALTNQAAFNTKMLDWQDAVLEAMAKQGEAQTTSVAAIEKMSISLETMSHNLDRLIKLLTPNTNEPKPDYKADKDEEGMMFG